jgi:hypothetical protein
MRGASFDHVECLVDSGTDDGMEELERILTAEEVEPDKCGDGRTELAFVDAGESGCVAQLDSVAEHRGRAEEVECLRPQTDEAKADDAGDALRSDLQQPLRVLGGGTDSVPCNGIQHRPDEQRISSRRRFESSRERVIRVHAVQLACQHGDRAAPERSGANRGRLRVGDQLGDECGIVALSLRGPRRRDDQQRHSLEPSC